MSFKISMNNFEIKTVQIFANLNKNNKKYFFIRFFVLLKFLKIIKNF